MSDKERGPKEPRVIVVMPASLVERIDNARYGKRIPSRSEAIRMMIENWLEVYEAGSPNKHER